jgi:nucleotidyltransferase/DNA polymerase involved in DNA repair
VPKLRLADFTTFTRGASFCEPTNFADLLFKKIKMLYNEVLLRNQKVRLVGVKVSNFG